MVLVGAPLAEGEPALEVRAERGVEGFEERPVVVDGVRLLPPDPAADPHRDLGARLVRGRTGPPQDRLEGLEPHPRIESEESDLVAASQREPREGEPRVDGMVEPGNVVERLAHQVAGVEGEDHLVVALGTELLAHQSAVAGGVLPVDRSVELSALIVDVPQSALVHTSPGGYLSRQGSSVRELAPEALRRLFQQRGRSGQLGPDEEIVAGAGVNTLDATLVDRFISSRTRQADEIQLAKLGLVREDDSGVLRATVAGVLLCTERPDEHIRGAAVEAVRYSGTVLGRATQLDAATITGPLDRQIRDVGSFARRNTQVAARKAPGRVEIPQFNPRAVFEAVVNAIVHRDYSLADAKIRLFLFDDRLELYSPGALPNTLPIEAMRQRQATRNETLTSLLRMLEVGDVHGAGDRQYYLEQRGEGVPIIYEETRALTGSEPDYELIGGAELCLTMPSARPPVPGIQGEVSVTAKGRPLAGATVLALYPNRTWMQEVADTFGRVQFGFHSELPITVFCAAPAHRARVERNWRPPAPLLVELEALPDGGSMVIPERTGHLPGLEGRLNPILDSLDRMYLYATNVAVDEGRRQPVHFKLNEAMRLTDVHGAGWMVRFVEMSGNSSVLEYEPPPWRSR